MELITAINALEKWRPIREWDDHINELPNTLKEEWNRILKAREEPMFKVSKQDVQDIVEAIQEDVPPSTVFRWYKINYTRKNAKILGINDVLDEYYARVRSFYVVDMETGETKKFANKSEVATFFKRRKGTISNYINSNKNVWGTRKRIYSYTKFKQVGDLNND
jgi:hypothetical protein